MPAAALRFRINLLGAVAFAAHLTIVVLSYIQAPALWRSRDDVPQANSFFDSLAARVPGVGLYRIFDDNGDILLTYYLPLAAATAAAAALVLLLLRRGALEDEALVRLLWRWSLAFAAVCLFAYPLFTQDFWLSAAWGRMIAAGDNPYSTHFTESSLAGLPLDHFPMLMSYGPGWGLLSGAIMAITGKSVLATAIVFKVFLAAAWAGSLFLVARIAAAQSVRDRCLALALFGWMPIGVTQTLAEGHNDIAMAWLALLWLHLLLRAKWTATAALAGSVLAKYVTGPLFLVDAIAALRLERPSWTRFLLRYAAPAALTIAAFAPFFRSLDFFDGTRLVNEWRFLMPRDALAAIEQAIGIPLSPLALAISVGLAAYAAYCLVALYRQPAPETIVKASLAVMSVVMFAVIAHLWPWYFVWTIGFAAVLPNWWLSRFVIGAASLAPFTLAFWWVDEIADYKDWGALAMYAGAALWVVATRDPRRRAGAADVVPASGRVP